MFRSCRNVTFLILLAFCGFSLYGKLVGFNSTTERMKIVVNNNQCMLLSPTGKTLIDMEVSGANFSLKNNTTTFGAQIQGSKVRIIDEDGTTVLCDMDYNGHVIIVTNVHGLKISDVDIKFKMDRKTGLISGINL